MHGESEAGSVVVRFLDHYSEFGSGGHSWTAQVLKAAIDQAPSPVRKKLLAVKVYAEFMSAIEDLGALCIAIRHRDDRNGLIYAYLTCGQRGNPDAPDTSLRDIFELMQPGLGFASALMVPNLQELLADNPALKESPVPQLYDELGTLLSTASKVYLFDERALVRAYNKTKHGFVVVEDSNIFQSDSPDVAESTVWIVVDNPDFTLDSAKVSSPVELYEIRLVDIAPMIDRIATIRGAVVGLCELVIYLLGRRLISAADHMANSSGLPPADTE